MAKSFIAHVNNASTDGTIASAIIARGHMLKLEVIAEGVETVQQLAFLRTQKCKVMQGHYFSKPLPALAIKQLLEAGALRGIELNRRGGKRFRHFSPFN